MSTTHEDAYGAEQARDSGQVLPGPSDYPCSINVAGVEPSKNKGTPGVDLTITVNDGAFKGTTIRNFDSIIYFTPGAKGNLGWVNHCTHQVTGERPDFGALARYGCPEPGEDNDANRKALSAWFAGMSPVERVDFIKEYARTSAWNGRTAMVAIDIEQSARQDEAGNPVLDEATGTQIVDVRNRVVNFHSYDDSSHGFANWERVFKPQQEVAFKAMGGGA